MTRSARLAFACLASFLILLPLSLKKPGLPLRLTGDEATYLSMAASLAHDRDLRCDRADLERLFAEFPFTGIDLELASDDGWATARFTGPVAYPLLAVPFVALWGANGPIALNAALFLLALACGWRHLCRRSSGGVALLFSLGFFLFSAAFVYLFRIQPQVMTMAAVAVAMALGWGDTDSQDRWARHRWVLSGAALGIAVLQEPVLVALAVPLLAGLSLARWRDVAGWLAGCGLTVALGALLSIALTGSAWPEHLKRADNAATFTVDNPLEVPRLPASGRTPWHDPDRVAEAGPQAETAGARHSFIELLEDSFLFVWGRRTGVLPYFPLVLPILLVFGAGRLGRPSGGRTEAGQTHREWLLLATLSALGVLQLIAEPVARALHQAQIGNPHMVGVYPAFLFLVPRLHRAVIVAGYGLGALVLGSLISTSLGVVVPGAGIHAHTRNLPLSLLPFEYPALGRAPGFHRLELHGTGGASPARLWAPADQAEIRGDELWLLGGEPVELWLESRTEVPSAVFLLRNLAAGNRVSMRMAGHEEARDLDQVPAGGLSFRLEFEPQPDKVRRDAGGQVHYYRLRLKTRVGEKPRWRQGSAPDYLGVTLAFLGTREFLGRDLYASEWLGCGVPPRVAPGEEFLAAGRLRNLSAHGWPHLGPARVRLSYRWLDAGGEEIPHASARTELPGIIEPGGELASWISIVAPRAPGNYTLELDPLFENVAWFSRAARYTRDPPGSSRRRELDASAKISPHLGGSSKAPGAACRQGIEVVN